MAPKAANAERAVAKGKGEKKSANGSNKQKGKRGSETYKIYLFKVLKQVHPEAGISSRAMLIMNEFMIDIFEKLAREASHLALYNKKPTLGSREIETALRLVVPGELAQHAAREATKAIAKYMSR